tara:strand:- start:179 stop:319 length:141 start_codon:yes stop_codon:yes gene_type:complete
MNFFLRIKEWYEEVTWKRVTREYCKKLTNAKMGIGDTVGQVDANKK